MTRLEIFLQAKSIVQAEIDAGPELVDFYRFNAQYAMDMVAQQPISPNPESLTNTTEYRGLEVGDFFESTV